MHQTSYNIKILTNIILSNLSSLADRPKTLVNQVNNIAGPCKLVLAN